MKFIASYIVVALSLSSCGKQQNQSVWWGGEQERMELTLQLELQNFRYDQLSTGDVTELESVRAESRAASDRVASLRRTRDELGDMVNAQQGRLAEFKQSTLRSLRQQAMHQTFETLCLASGRKFEKVSISLIDDSGVTIRHSDGSARLVFSDLDAEQQRFFGLDGDLALAAMETETREAVAYERWITKRMESARLAQATVALENHRDDSESQGRYSVSPAPQIVASNVHPLRQPAKSVGSSHYRSYRSSYDRTYYPIYRPVYYDTPHCGTQPTNGITLYPPIRYPAEYFRNPTVTDRHSSFADITIPSNP